MGIREVEVEVEAVSVLHCGGQLQCGDIETGTRFRYDLPKLYIWHTYLLSARHAHSRREGHFGKAQMRQISSTFWLIWPYNSSALNPIALGTEGQKNSRPQPCYGLQTVYTIITIYYAACATLFEVWRASCSTCCCMSLSLIWLLWQSMPCLAAMVCECSVGRVAAPHSVGHTVWASVLCTLTPFSRSYRTGMLGALCVYCVIISGEAALNMVCWSFGTMQCCSCCSSRRFWQQQSKPRGGLISRVAHQAPNGFGLIIRVCRNASSHGSYISSALLLESVRYCRTACHVAATLLVAVQDAAAGRKGC